MTYGSVCSGIEAATVAPKRKRPPRQYDPAKRRCWNFRTRYGITAAQADELLRAQDGVCAVCQKPPRRAVVDHDHVTGRVRGILCHPCNVMMGSLENIEFRRRALAYLGQEGA